MQLQSDCPNNSFHHLISGLLRSARKELENAGSDPEKAIHDFRRYLKMARAALRLGRAALSEQEFQHLNNLLRDSQARLSENRDHDALIEVCVWLHGKQQNTTLHLLEQLEQTLRAQKKAALDPAAAIDDALSLLNQAETILDKIVFSDKFPMEEVIAQGICRSYTAGKKCLRAIRQGDASQDIWHTWRKRAKDLRYQIGFIRWYWPGMLGAWERELHHLTDYLGRQRDLFLLRERITLPDSPLNNTEQDPVSQLLNTIESARKKQAEKAVGLGGKLYSEPSRYWRKRIMTLYPGTHDSKGAHLRNDG